MTADARAAFALHRFGFGGRAARPAPAGDPRDAILAELDRPGAGQIDPFGLLASAAAARDVFDRNAERRAAQLRQKKAAGEGGMETPTAPPPTAGMDSPQRNFQREVRARVDAAVNAEIGFAERLVWFWSNHFCISMTKAPGRGGGYEREAIRPFVLGRFADMLRAAVLHPAMLLFLDNAQSIGPDSVAGVNGRRGLNENLAREVLELHTVGIASGYTQEDVTSFAKVLTGWTILPPAIDPERGGEVIFNRRRHEPGAKTVLGKSYADTGPDQARAVLDDLARHPATATHVATKLACHFVADTPPTPLITHLAARFRDSDGDLKEVAKALLASPEAWEAKPGKVKRPGEWMVAILRAAGRDAEVPRIVQAHNLLGEPLWRPPSPKGFADDNAAWTDGIAQRLDIANVFARRIAGEVEPAEMLENGLGALASAETRGAIKRAESRAQAIALLAMAPEFLRR